MTNFYFNADPDPAFLSIADPQPWYQSSHVASTRDILGMVEQD